MSIIMQRTVTLLSPKEDLRFGKKNLSLTDFESDPGYVLLGEPGMGKSTEFDIESERVGAPKPISARIFMQNGIQQCSLPPHVPVFIDGLDEARLIGGSPEDTIQQIISHLTDLGNPKFRISCRPDSWLRKRELQQLSSSLSLANIPVLRLDPLHSSATQQIVGNQRSIKSVLNHQLDDHWLESFFQNPQLLHLLLEAVPYDGRYRSPMDIFDKACTQLAKKSTFNTEHTVGSNSLLYHAGLLCTLLLILNKCGWDLEGKGHHDAISLFDLPDHDRPMLCKVLQSDVFIGPKYCRTPAHRLIAEFLGAQYLSDIIFQGLGWRRALSLLIDPNGNPRYDLKGLASWLATFNSEVRSYLIHSDPSVLAFDGDPRNLTDEQRQNLFLNLENRIPFDEMFPFKASLGSLNTSEGLSTIWKLVSSDERSEKRQDLLCFLLSGVKKVLSGSTGFDQSLTAFTPQNPSVEQILNILYDPSWKVKTRILALDALNQMIYDTSNHETILYDILHDLKNESLQDEDNEIFCAVLDNRFRDHLSTDELWNYLKSLSVHNLVNVLVRLIEKAEGVQIKRILEIFCSQSEYIIPQLDQVNRADLGVKLIFKGLQTYGDQMDIPDLYDWFELIEFKDDLSPFIPVNSFGLPSLEINHQDYYPFIIQWLNNRKSIQYQLVEFGLTQQKHNDGDTKRDEILPHKFLGRNVSRDFRLWCLTRAIELAHVQPCASIQLANWTILEKKGWAAPIGDDQVTEFFSTIDSLRLWNDKRLFNKANHSQKEDLSGPMNTELEGFSIEKGQQQELSYLQLKADEVIQGRCSLNLLDKLARIYFYGQCDSRTGQDYLSKYLNEDKNLADAVWSGFRSLLARNDLPDLDAIAQMYQRGEQSIFATPILAVLEEDGEATFGQFSENEKLRVLGFYFVTELAQPQDFKGHPPKNLSHPDWYKFALEHDPKAVADAMVTIHRASVRSGASPTHHFLSLSSDRYYAKVAPLVVRRKLITIFPTKCSGLQLKSLRSTLLCILRVYSMGSETLNKEEIKNLILHRLNRKNIGVAQQALLISAGLCIAPNQCVPHLIHFLSTGRAARIRHILSFFDSEGREVLCINIRHWSCQELCIFIQTIGRYVQKSVLLDTPHTLNSKEIIPKGVQDLLDLCITEISRRVSHNAAVALSTLISDENLIAWKPEIVEAMREQAFREQNAHKKDLSLSDIMHTLKNGSPSTSSDLHSVAVEFLEDLAIDMRDPSSNNWFDYWDCNLDDRILFPKPKPEKAMHELFVSTFKKILHNNDIHAHITEDSIHDGKIGLCLRKDPNLWIPMVIRSNLSLDIWSRIPQHFRCSNVRLSTDGGHWVYVVYWFGGLYTNVVSPSGISPKTSNELRELLEYQIYPNAYHLTSIIVIDVSPRGNPFQELRLLSH